MQRRTRFASLAALLLAPGLAWAADYKIDGSHTSVLWKAKHLGMSYTHGRFNSVSGSLAWDDDVAKSKIEVEIKADSVDSNDAKRDQHLKGPDFFNTKQFPTITFKSTKIEKKGDAYEVTGELDLHGVKKEIKTTFTLVGQGKTPFGDERIGAETTFTVKRSDFGMNWKPEAVGDEVSLTVAIEAVKEKK